MANKNPQLNQYTKDPEPSAGGTESDHGQEHAQDVIDEETEKGYHGTTVDDGDYTVAGSVAGKNKPTEGKGA